MSFLYERQRISEWQDIGQVCRKVLFSACHWKMSFNPSNTHSYTCLSHQIPQNRQSKFIILALKAPNDSFPPASF